MSKDLAEALVESISQHHDAARQVPAETSGKAPEARHPLDWDNAVETAVARLEASWVHPDVTGHMLSSGLADELAATLCAFGMIGDEACHQPELPDERETGEERTPRKTLE